MRPTRQQVIDLGPTTIFVYADDRSRKALRGQAETYGMLPHCFPIFTRLWCCADTNAQVWVVDIETYQYMLESMCFETIREAINMSPHKQICIVHGIGEGCSQLKQKAPLHYKVIADFLLKLQKDHKAIII